ncbi:MAG: hypothetical protein AB8B84_04885 [Granulosicoccus sp.]
MNEHTDGPNDFNADYANLRLENTADWKTARLHYRKLVHIWHPDKYSDKPRERIHAQKQFIALNKSYNHLKAFYKQYGSLPFQDIVPEVPRPDAELNGSANNAGARGKVDPANLNLDKLSRDDDKIDERIIKPNPARKIIWILTACFVIFSTIVLFFILDRKANLQNLQKGQQVLREAPESEFTPTPAEIRRGQTKGAFIR